MAWNEPGNKGKDPWGNKGNGGNDKGPPDLEDIFRGMSKRMGGKGNGSSFGKTGVLIFLAIALVVWGISGFYTIKEAEKGVVLRFGQYIGVSEPGLHWQATFIDKVYPVNVKNIRSLPASGSMLTADENVVRVELEVQYEVEDPYLYLFSSVDANASLREATDSALRYVVGHNKMDDILTTGREEIRKATLAEIERIIKPYKLGLEIKDVNVLPARPPEEVKDAFDDAIAAQEDEQRSILEAKAYAREVEPRARGQVERIFQQASAYQQNVILDAKGKAARFEKLLPEYRQAPDVTRKRLYLDTMQEVLAGNSKVLIDSKNGNNLMYLPLDKLMEKGNTHKSQPMQFQVVPNTEHSTHSNGSHSTNSGTPGSSRLTREQRMRQSGR
ncbi:FtsH protease activity modulator HflK [Shewanella sp. 202IG2-18]|uniref:FtsH protease activity modulator HflK n=1 Tax=Parashewanella hymeniacidonis TaxID=2807618 RepID=UPI00196095AB|nr:FtsH protease activity modulator HflK [Parashewanella hymeniacidonis]MBM7071605.1 FtsH protease activity modulator HflK [Parashewanella hymeniacidonis]